MPFAATWTDLEIILSEVNRTRERQISYDITYMLNTIKMIKNIYMEKNTQISKPVLQLPW